MHPSGGYGFDGGNGFQTAGRAKAMPYHGLTKREHRGCMELTMAILK
jgi:hypothetical protein